MSEFWHSVEGVKDFNVRFGPGDKVAPRGGLQWAGVAVSKAWRDEYQREVVSVQHENFSAPVAHLLHEVLVASGKGKREG